MLKIYRSSAEYSYTLGAFPTFELLKFRPDVAEHLYLHPDFVQSEAAERLIDLAKSYEIKHTIDSKIFRRLSPKENCYVIASFAKYSASLNPTKNHLILVNPSDMGNLGTIMRTMLGFAVLDLCLIKPAPDLFDPKVIRASMGAIFALRFSFLESISEYQSQFSRHQLYPLISDANILLEEVKLSGVPYALVLGNEARGLDVSFHGIGTPLRITHEKMIDSLNITVAAGIALESFYRRTC
jgi:TrmH family RNA methyltransferase